MTDLSSIDFTTSQLINYSRIGFLYEPIFRRQRHRYQGVRESQKINEEVHQFYTDIVVLYGRKQAFDDKLQERVELLLDGGQIPGVQYNWDNDATPFNAPLVLQGLNTLSTRVEMLQRRLENLED